MFKTEKEPFISRKTVVSIQFESILIYLVFLKMDGAQCTIFVYSNTELAEAPIRFLVLKCISSYAFSFEI